MKKISEYQLLSDTVWNLILRADFLHDLAIIRERVSIDELKSYVSATSLVIKLFPPQFKILKKINDELRWSEKQLSRSSVSSVL